MLHLSFIVLKEIRLVALSYTGNAHTPCKSSGMLATAQPQPPGFNTNQLDFGIVEKSKKKARRIRPSAYAGIDSVGQSGGTGEHLLARFKSNNALEIGNYLGKGMWATGRAQRIMGVLH